MHEPAARVGQRLLFIAPLREVRRESVQILYVDIVYAPLVIPRVLFHKLVLFLVLVFLFAKAVVVELFLMHVVNEIDIIFDLFFITDSYSIIFAGFKIGCGKYLIVFP